MSAALQAGTQGAEPAPVPAPPETTADFVVRRELEIVDQLQVVYQREHDLVTELREVRRTMKRLKLTSRLPAKPKS